MTKHIEILSIASTGNGTGFLEEEIEDKKEKEGKKKHHVPYFVPYTAPGDVVEIQNEKKNKKYVEAEIKEIIKKSKHRIENPCKHYQVCGGCNLLHLNYDEQVKQKIKIVEQILDRNKIEHPKINVIPCYDNQNYRYKAKLFVTSKDGFAICGFKKRKSDEIVEIYECHIVHKKIAELMRKINEEKIPSNDNKESELNVVVDYKTQKIAIDSDGKAPLEVVRFLKNHTDFLNKPANFEYEIQSPSNRLIFKYNNKTFIQSNLEQNKELVKIVCDNIKSNNYGLALDLYGGNGNLALSIANKLRQVTTVEGNQEATDLAKKNCEINNILNVECYQDDVKDFLRRTVTSPDTIILDPPRTGCEDEVIEIILNILPKQIIYVACDQVALKDNLKSFLTEYKIKKLYFVDMFPHTEHIETVTILERK